MSVIDKNIIDGMAFDEDENKLILEIYDHLSEEDSTEYDHLIMLQDKLNTYLQFINSGQYLDSYPGSVIRKVLINVHFKYKITDNFINFLNYVNKELMDSIIHVCIYVK